MDTIQHDAPSALTAGRVALAEHRWQEAFELLSQADRESGLGVEDLEGLANAAWFTAHPDETTAAKERAFRRLLDDGDPDRAAIVAFDLARENGLRGNQSVASAWSRRAERLLEGRPETVAHGYQELTRSWVSKLRHEIDLAIEQAARAADIGARFGDADLQAWALIQQGSTLIATGRTDEGFPLMEEATIAAVNGEVSPFTAGVVYCQMIAVCRNTTDYRRAGEWTDAARRWCERQAINGFPGVCRVHRAEIEGLQGGFHRAAEELLKATDELMAYRATGPLGDGFYALGEVRLRMGDLEGAEDALRQAHGFGRVPQPALALLRLAEGKLRTAEATIKEAVEELSWDRWTTARLLPAEVEIALAAGDLPTARGAAEELAKLAETFDSPALHATRHESFGRVLVAEGEQERAAKELREAIRHWRDVGAPYDVARARVVLASALRDLERVDEASMELRTALAEFERLGAARDAGAVADAIAANAERDAAPATTRKAFLFTDIVNSTGLAEALGDEAWEHLLRWHDDALRALFARHGGEVVKSTGDGFFAAFDSPARAIDCAVAIQHALAEHRRSSGFAPGVRIGVHAADATRRADDYSGRGVHVAARIAALARTGEVLASEDTARAAGNRHAVSDARSVTLKGVGEPVDVVAVTWT